jgi:hypothetical protein
LLTSSKIFVYLSITALVVKLILSKAAENAVFDQVFEPNYLSYLCDMVIFLTAFSCITKVSNEFRFFYFAFAILLLTLPLSSYLNDRSAFDAIKSLLRIFSPLFAFIHYSNYFKDKKEELIKVSLIIIFVSITLIMYGFAVLPPAHNREDGLGGGLWWPAYFTNLHTTTYVVISLFFIVYSLYILKYQRVNKFILISSFIITFYAIAFGWGIRTSTLSLLVLLCCLVHKKYSKKIEHMNVISFFVISLILIFFFTIAFDFSVMDKISSGRLSMYVAKYYQLSDNSFINWLIGSGAGSDLIRTKVWWWDAKGAHSDFITSLVEGGIVYLGLFIMIHIKLFQLLKYSQLRYVVISIIITGLFSNGYFDRPLAMYVVIFALVIGYCDSHNKATQLCH